MGLPGSLPAVAADADEPVTAVAKAYRLFARREAWGRSAAYESLAESVADDVAVAGFVASLPPGQRPAEPAVRRERAATCSARRRHPPAAERAGWPESPAELAQVILARRVQTNEPGRCAVLLPGLAQLPQPLALIDVGASAGLTLLLDRYSYDYAGRRIAGSDPHAPVLRCQPSGPLPLPRQVPAITWRAGLDLNPLDVTADDDVRWLSCLVWPEEGRARAQRLAAAVASARRDPPPVHRGDLLTGLPALAAQAPPDATLVIYHCSVLYQVPAREREQFAATVRRLGARSLSSESPASCLAPRCEPSTTRCAS